MSLRTAKLAFPQFARVTVVAAVLAMSSSSVLAQSYDDNGDPAMRVEQLEGQLRRLTGQNEELQHRNRMLEQQLQQLQGGATGGQPAGSPPAQQATPAGSGYGQSPPRQPSYGQPSNLPSVAGQPPVQQEQAPIARGPGRGDAFDPSRNPNAPGAPQVLGSTRPSGPPSGQGGAAVGAPGGRDAGEPLNLSNVGSPSQSGNGGGGGLTTLPPSASPRDEFDLGIGYMQRKDYALAEETMRNFTRRYPNDKQVSDAQYWVGESLFQRQKYREAAESFLAVTSKYDTSAKAPDALLRLGQSLAALKEKEAACAALGEVARKYPQASRGIKQAVDREQKRVKC
ncbi:MAG: tol-pal system protein YbgF [Rhizobiales bacterium]|nr:tol-pal system protein YbgF [Hyphomicrobiales bacterium]MBN8985489.1 tol-pal system protein YbgF [Hyphomicrobiales bacterium]